MESFKKKQWSADLQCVVQVMQINWKQSMIFPSHLMAS